MEFPIEIKKAMNCLAEENRQKIALALIDKKLAYTELKRKCEFTNGNLNHHLLELTKAGIINRYLGTEESGPYEKYYAITDFGRDFLQGIFTALTPTQKPEQINQIATSRHALMQVIGGVSGIVVGVNYLAAANNKKPTHLLGTSRQMEGLTV